MQALRAAGYSDARVVGKVVEAAAGRPPVRVDMAGWPGFFAQVCTSDCVCVCVRVCV